VPKPTFHNLSPEKRDAFVNRCLLEFGLHRFREASISRIVADLGIAKGSVYQYFDDKRELYLYLLDLAATKKLSHIQTKSEGSSAAGGFFELYSRIIHAGAEFDFSEPRYSLLLANAGRETETEELGDIAGELERRSSEFLARFIETAVEAGEVRSDIDSELVAHVVNSVTLGLASYMEGAYQFSLPDLLRNPDQEPPFTSADLHQAIDSFMLILRDGLSGRNA
jgi:AcrR family transcriptional regulator